MRENRRRHELHRVQQASRHLQETDLQSKGDAVCRRTPLQDDLLFCRCRREETLDFQRRQGWWKAFLPKITLIPTTQLLMILWLLTGERLV